MARAQNREQKLYDIIDDLEIAMLTTVEANGMLHSRPMANQAADDKGDIWFFTDRSGSVSKNVAKNPKVSLTYSNASSRYVAVSGKGKIVDDSAKIDELWSEDFKAWFPKGKSDPELVLLRVTPDRGEFWDAGNSTIVSAIAYLKAKVTGQKGDDLMDNRKVTL